jgi:eukaryotic-like serine/threonine-protein kinase
MDDASTTNQSQPPSEDPPDLLIGKEFLNDQFRILAKIASGGMGSIYMAEQPSLQRMVAVKILHPELARRKDLVQRFHREAKATSCLSHPNTIRTYLYGELPDHTLYIVMEYLEGANLLQTIRRTGPLSVERAVGVIAQIAAALDEAHQAGIVHRDLKSENVFLTTVSGVTDFVKILDFGIATLRQGDETTAALTAAGMVFGTPQYMSPEQARGKELDGRSDLYSLGIIFYEALTGFLPWDAKVSMDYITCHLTEPPQPMSKRAPQAKIPQEIEAVVRRLLRKDPEERYRSGAELGRALVEAWTKAATRGVLSVQLPAPLTIPAFAGPPPPIVNTIEISAAPPKRWGAFLVAGFLLLALIGGAIAYWLQAPIATTQSATLTIVTSPPDAKIFLNGEPIAGQSPYMLRELVPGPYEVKGEAPNYEPGRSRIQLEPGMLGAVDVRLTAIPPQMASLSIEVIPEDAEIVLDGALTKIGSLISSNLKPGEHSLRITAKGYIPLQTTIDLIPGKEKPRRYWLIPQKMELEVASKPKNAEIRLFDNGNAQDKGKVVGRTNSTVKNLRGEKEYRVELSLKGHETTSRVIRLDPTKELTQQLSFIILLKEASETTTIKIIPDGATSKSRAKALAGGRDIVALLDRNRSGGVSEAELALFPGIDLLAANNDKDPELSADEIANYGPTAWGLSGSSPNAAAVARTMKLGLGKFSKDLMGCVESSGRVLVDFVISADGRVIGAAPRSVGFAGKKEGSCVEAILKKMRFVPPGQKLEIAFDVEIEVIKEEPKEER